MNNPLRKVGAQHTRMIEATAMGAQEAVVGDSRAHLACLQTLHGAVTPTHTLLRAAEDMVVAHHHNAARKVDALGCPTDHACVNHCLLKCSMVYWSLFCFFLGTASMSLQHFGSMA
jgi:hypothetical protein